MIRIPIFILSILLVAETGFSQTEQQLLPAERKQQTLITQPITLYKGFLRIGIGTEYIIANTLFDGNGDRQARFNGIASRWNILPAIEYGITDRLQVKAIFPFTTVEGSISLLAESPFDGTVSTIKREVTSKGFEDIQVEAGYQFLIENETRPSLTLFVNASIPTAEKNPIDSGDPEKIESPTGNGNFRLKAILNARKINYPFLFSGTVAYLYQFEGTKSFALGEPEMDFKDSDLLEINGQVGFHVNEWMAIINDIGYETTVGDITRDGDVIESLSAYVLNYSPTFTFQIKRLRVNQFLTFPIIGKNTTADPRYELGVQYVF